MIFHVFTWAILLSKYKTAHRVSILRLNGFAPGIVAAEVSLKNTYPVCSSDLLSLGSEASAAVGEAAESHSDN